MKMMIKPFSMLGILLIAAVTARAGTIIFTVLPDTTISGAPGSTIGFGYALENETSYYYQPTSLSAGSFHSATPTDIFDFPIVAPHTSVFVAFSEWKTSSCGVPPCGLYEFLMDHATTTLDTGWFILSGEFYADGAGTLDLGASPDLSAAYSVVLETNSAAPEATYYLPVALGVMGIFWRFNRPWFIVEGEEPNRR